MSGFIGNEVVSIHTPYAGSDYKWGDNGFKFAFQSTLPMQGVTLHGIQ